MSSETKNSSSEIVPLVVVVRHATDFSAQEVFQKFFTSRFSFNGVFLVAKGEDSKEVVGTVQKEVLELRKRFDRVGVIDVLVGRTTPFEVKLGFPAQSLGVYMFSYMAERSFLVGDLISYEHLTSIEADSVSMNFDLPENGIFSVYLQIDPKLFFENELGPDLGNRIQSSLMMLVNSVQNSLSDPSLFIFLRDKNGNPVRNPAFSGAEGI